MRMTQVSAFLENRPGRLLHVLEVLAQAGVNVLAHTIVDAADFGIVHLIVADPSLAMQALRQAGIVCTSTTVLVVDVPDAPGAFVQKVLRPLAEAGVNIQYSYAFGAPINATAAAKEEPRPRLVLKVNDLESVERALGILPAA